MASETADMSNHKTFVPVLLVFGTMLLWVALFGTTGLLTAKADWFNVFKLFYSLCCFGFAFKLHLDAKRQKKLGST